MPVPVRTYATLRLSQLLWLALLVLLTAPPLFAGGSGPAVRIPLDSLGFEPQSPQFLAAGSSMLTVNYVDSNHLLFTFGVHRLMERIPNDPPDDEDRTVEAVLVELPSGHVLARTDWRLHDNGQYLWSLGHGRFLLRTHDTLTTFAPMANLTSGQPFRQRDFLTTDRRIGVVLLSPESDLMIVESVERTPPAPAAPASLFGPDPKPAPEPLGKPGDPDPVALNFYRLALPDTGDVVEATLAGIAHAAHFGGVAAMGAGHIAIVDEGRQEWGFDFHPFNGKVKELAPFASTCNPMPRFVSSSEFVAFGCHTGDLPQVIGGFNLRGEEMWEQNLFGDYVATFMTFAPTSGRFALGRVMGEAASDNLDQGAGLTGQSVVVYQMDSGKQILHVDCSPVVRAGQNFALSPDGMSLAAIRENSVEIFPLPPLSKKDQSDLKEARAMIPQGSELPIEFAGPTPAPAPASPASAETASAVKATSPATQSAATAPVAPPSLSPPPPTQPAAAVTTTAVGDAAPEQHRKRPTLYTLPGETPPGNDGDGPK
ncbi:hypothetical protein [Edaphobacter dinghuensis]|uniref:Uncharacterized protein n=1 Tax=Edaphobacter dinghuensis TaxID=1560005 RepID=A0A917HHA1_9BACT|nr:hypothetical protein [Edaphobacter dinghuensis]GGG78061.1 hypothetical protein GCM10011585_21550 [Edaphobacter dinghuensis]